MEIDPSNSEKPDQITWTSDELGLGHKFYRCSFCKRGFSNAQALGGHMNIHRKDRARLREFSRENLLSLDIKNSINPPPPPAPANKDSLQHEVSCDETISSSSKRPCVNTSEEDDHKVNYDDHNHEMIIGDFLQLPLFKETPLIKEASNCVDKQVQGKSMQLNPVSELDLELRLGMEPHLMSP